MSIQRLPRDKKLNKRSSELRSNATKEENHLWYDYLRTYPIHFNRQQVIGENIVDFYCSKAKLVVELDGSQHSIEKVMEYDHARSHFLESLGMKVLRFTNLDVIRNFDKVCSEINTITQQRIK